MNEKLNTVNVCISRGNVKMGAIPSVSLPPILTCAENAPCTKKCYACKICRFRPSVMESYKRNYDVLRTDPAAYWRAVRAAVLVSRYFRFHVAGDIPSADYLTEMVRVAEENAHCQILCFTKKYDIVNAWLDANGGTLPRNLHVIFSRWDAVWNVRIRNPYDLPMSAVIFKSGCDATEYTKVCGGNCYECACQGVGCWELKAGETIAFYEH